MHLLGISGTGFFFGTSWTGWDRFKSLLLIDKTSIDISLHMSSGQPRPHSSQTSFENISQVMTSLMFVCHWVTDGEKNFWIIWKTNNSTTVCISLFSNFNLKPDVLSFWEDEIDNGREDEEDGAAKMRKLIIMMVIWFQQMQSQRPPALYLNMKKVPKTCIFVSSAG